MSQSYKGQRARKYCVFLVTLFLTTNMAACNFGETQNPKSAFQLFIFSNVGPKRLLYNASQLEYQDWLDNVDLTKAEFRIDNTSISSFVPLIGKTPDTRLAVRPFYFPLVGRRDYPVIWEEDYYYGLLLTLNTDASRRIVQFLEPNTKVDFVLHGEYSLACTVDKAFLIVVQGERTVGGMLRCPTEMLYQHPQIFVDSQHGKVLLDLETIDTPLVRQINSSLAP